MPIFWVFFSLQSSSTDLYGDTSQLLKITVFSKSQGYEVSSKASEA